MSDVMMHMSEAANAMFLCRLCGIETASQNNVIHIFDTNGIALDIKSKIINCLGFDVRENDCLPKVLCAECVDNLEKFNAFKIKSNRTAFYLIDLLRKQMTLDGNKSSIQPDNNQDTYLNTSNLDPNIQVKEEPIDPFSNPNCNIPNQTPPSQLYDIFSPLCIINEMTFPTNIHKRVFPSFKNNVPINMKTKFKSKASRIKKSKAKTIENKIIKKVEVKPIEYTEYKCDHCSKVKDTKEKIYRHIKHHLEELLNHSCTLCDVKLKSKCSLIKHMKIHNKQFDYVCNYCGKCMVTKAHLDVHVRTAHTKEYPFECTKCDKKYPTKGSLKTHQQTAHNDEYNYTCDICNKSFKIENYLKTHQKRNHGPAENRKKFKCNLCDAAYVCISGLRDHISGHTGELNFGCDRCDKRYKNKKGLDIHMLTHTGEKNCVCEFCGKAFALNSSLVDHRRIHTGERPFKCSLCQKSFNQRSALNRHKKSCAK